ncbi:ral guanine nucleotide dissociation stimulator-like [Phyllostomus discolor]|uniref:Ral guanine nucleotide dissociation stimulator-like n=1 Tax=Phyllostomus discolor TaxID=89673 RepID=A0A7E6EHI6_9CHIR|nr:ral guanine nucleotide dissociation stimulator-like [Phyllostomus discolor]
MPGTRLLGARSCSKHVRRHGTYSHVPGHRLSSGARSRPCSRTPDLFSFGEGDSHATCHRHRKCPRDGRRDVLLTPSRYGCIFPYCEEDRGPQERQRQAISSILDIWLDQHPEDFFQPPEFLCLMMLLAYLELNFPGSDLEHRAQLLLSELQHLEPSQADTQEPAAEQEQEIPEEEMPSAGPSPGPEPAPGTAVTQLQEAEPLKAPEPLVFAAGRPTYPGTQPLALLTAPGTERPSAL